MGTILANYSNDIDPILGPFDNLLQIEVHNYWPCRSSGQVHTNWGWSTVTYVIGLGLTIIEQKDELDMAIDLLTQCDIKPKNSLKPKEKS